MSQAGQIRMKNAQGIGRPKDLSLREAVVVACGYMRQNITQEVWAEIFDTSQPVISGIITKFTPLIEASTEEDRPTADEAKEAAARERTVLVDGFLAPTWSWRDTPELWSGKHKTTGFNGQAIANLRGDLLFVSEPVTGHNHDMTALAETETAEIIAAAYSGIGDKGVHSRGTGNWSQLMAGSGGSQGLPSSASRMASSAVMP
jgi:hypothetical protein